MPVTIATETPLSPDVRRLIGDLNAVLVELSPPEFCFHMSAEEMAGPETTVFVARDGGKAVAMGALHRHGEGRGEGIAEVKRMYTAPSHQGRGLGGRILNEIVALAEREGLSRLVLETGDKHPAAWRIYERAGFARCGPVLDYPDSAYSVFYSRPLQAQSETLT